MYVNVWVGSRERMDITLLFSSFHYLGHSSTLWASARESSLLPRASSRPQLCIVSISSQSPPSSPGQMPSHSSAFEHHLGSPPSSPGEVTSHSSTLLALAHGSPPSSPGDVPSKKWFVSNAAKTEHLKTSSYCMSTRKQAWGKGQHPRKVQEGFLTVPVGDFLKKVCKMPS